MKSFTPRGNSYKGCLETWQGVDEYGFFYFPDAARRRRPLSK
jgi:hypothetical protein